MNQELLTIAIPTFNRVKSLRLLLRSLRSEIVSLEADVQVMVSDNASTDSTPDVLSALQSEWPALVVHRNVKNIGAERNFCICLERARSEFIWVLGDDDLPKAGVIAKMVDLLRAERPDIVHLGSEWVSSIVGPEQGEPVSSLTWRRMDALTFARCVHVWFTFISGSVINRRSLPEVLGQQTLQRYVGTNLVQLGWIYPLLKSASRFILVSNRCVLATKDNTGGYGLMTVFGVNYARVTRDVFGRGSAVGETLISSAAARYLPGLFWSSRAGSSDRFVAEAPWEALRQELGTKVAFWLLLVPIGQFPKAAALPIYQFWRVGNRLARELDRLKRALATRRPDSPRSVPG